MVVGEISAYWQKPTVSPVVQVDSPGAAEKIRRLYPYDRPTFTTNWEAMSGMAEAKADLPAFFAGTLAAIIIGYLSHKSMRKPMSLFGMATSGAIAGSVIYGLIKSAAE